MDLHEKTNVTTKLDQTASGSQARLNMEDLPQFGLLLNSSF